MQIFTLIQICKSSLSGPLKNTTGPVVLERSRKYQKIPEMSPKILEQIKIHHF